MNNDDEIDSSDQTVLEEQPELEPLATLTTEEVNQSEPVQLIEPTSEEINASDQDARTETEDEDEDEDDEEDEEPLFKYQRLEGEVEKVFQGDSACAIVASEKLMAVGTHNGVVYIINHRIQILKRFRPHSATIYDLKLDTSDTFFASASMDGKISIIQISGGTDVFILDLKRPMRSIALEPLYHKHPNKRHFVSGGLAGNLILHEKGWLSNKETVLHSGEGAIWSIHWHQHHLIWANDAGLRILDINTHHKIAFVPRSSSEPRPDLYQCHFAWADPQTLLVGWADTIRVISIIHTPPVLGGLNPVSASNSTTVEVVGVFQVDCIISGLCAWGDQGDLAVLAHVLQPDQPTDHQQASSKRRPAERPELRIISKLGEETSSDALSINHFERYQAHDYLLCPLPPTSARARDSSAFAGLYVLAPHDLILVELRTRSDHISWMIEHQDYEGAMKEVEAAGLAGAQGYSLSEIGKKYLDHLVHQGKYQTAAQASAGILGNDTKAWEDWIFLLTEKGHLETIIPYVPVEAPRLSKLVYEVILVHLLRKDPDNMLVMIQRWPSDLYNLSAVISATQDRLNRAGETFSKILMTCLSELLILNHQPGKALTYFLRLRKAEVFDLIHDHNLFTDVQDQVLQLMSFNDELTDRPPRTALDLLVHHTESIPVPRVVAQLSDHRRYLCMYLDSLFDVDPLLGSDYADMHVDLFAEFDRGRLMEYLRASNTYNLEKAYKICGDLDFVGEMVYLLGRMGNNKKALFLIIDRIGDVQRAIEFAKEQNDHDLWEDLLRYSETRPAFIKGLLNNVGSEIDPIRLIRRIQNGLEIPGLKASIIKILQDFKLQISLTEGCRSMLVSDCRELSKIYYSSQTKGALGDSSLQCQKCEGVLSEEAKVWVMFLCRHSFHASCVFEEETAMAAAGIKDRLEQALILRSGTCAGCPICTAGPGSRRP